MTSQKVLVTGSAVSLGAYFAKLATLQAKHTFSLCLALDLFSGTADGSIELAQLLAGEIVVPLPVYVAWGRGALPAKVAQRWRDGEEVCENVRLLDKSGLLQLASGLRIATFSGAASDPADTDSSGSSFTTDELSSYLSLLSPAPTTSLLPSAPPASPDILLTYCYPPSVNLLSKKLPILSAPPAIDTSLPPRPVDATTESRTVEPEVLDKVALASRAKYHFVSGKKAFFEREPFVWGNQAGKKGGVCRFISLGEMGGLDRWFYAFSITPAAPSPPVPANATPSPFSAVLPTARGTKRPYGAAAGGDQQDVNEFGIPNYIFEQAGAGKRRTGGGGGSAPPSHYTCNICQEKGHWIQECPSRDSRDRERGPQKILSPDECWFCLSNPAVTKHLIVSIGGETYLTFPKGPLLPTPAAGEVGVPGGGHVLIIPIAHHPTLRAIPADTRPAVEAEIESYRVALGKFFAEHGCGLVEFEIGKVGGRGGHGHLHMLPVPLALLGTVKEHFIEQGMRGSVVYEDEATLASDVWEGTTDHYFRVAWAGVAPLEEGGEPQEIKGELVHLIHEDKGRFDLQFGRTTLATLLQMEDRIDWKSCTGSVVEEKRDVTLFKKGFAAYDPSL